MKDDIRGKGPVKIVNGKAKDFDLYDMEADDLYDELYKLEVISKAIDEILEERKSKNKDEIDKEIPDKKLAGKYQSDDKGDINDLNDIDDIIKYLFN